MGKEQKDKAYAVIATVKPKSEGIVRYKPFTVKGIVFSKNPTIAKELTIEMVLNSLNNYEPSVTRPKITREMITVKKCELFNDFIISIKNGEANK